MKVLITGGYGFIGSQLAERFYKEGHKITVLDNLSTGREGRLKIKHKSILANCEDEKNETYFRTYGFDLVIHCAAQTSVPLSVAHPTQDAEANIVGLVNMLDLAAKYKVKKFVFFSSAAVYGDSHALPIREDAFPEPTSPYGISKMVGETYCTKWSSLHGLETLVFRLSNVYGPGQSSSHESGVIAKFTTASIHNEPITVYGDGEQTRDYIHVGDVVEAVYRAVISQLSGTYNISTNKQTSLDSVIRTIEAIQPFQQVRYESMKPGDILHSQLDNTKIKQKIDWAPRYSIQDGILDTWKREYEQVDTLQPESPDTPLLPAKKEPTFLMRLIENGVLFTLFLAAILLLPSNLIPVDMWLVYILFAGLLFGKYQAMIASLLAVSVLSFQQVQNGREFASLIADNSLLVTFTLYLVIGFIVGYIVDRRKIELAFAQEEKEIADEKLVFMSSIYEDTREIKDELQTQILYSEDSLGKIYQAVHKLDYLEPEEVFSQAIEALETLLHHNQFGIYSVSTEGDYLRLVARSTKSGFSLSPSLQTRNTVFERSLKEQAIVFNTDFQENMPTFAAPIVADGLVIGMVAGYDVPFERLSLYYKNTIDISLRLISEALLRAYQHVDEVRMERYVGETHVLKPAYYAKVLASKEKSYEKHQMPFTRLHLIGELTDQQLRQVELLLRSHDFIGQVPTGQLECLLSNTTPIQAEVVRDRLKSYSIETEHVLKGV